MMRLNRERLGAAFRAERERMGLTVRALSARTGVSIATISRAERAHPDVFASAETALILSTYFWIDPREFVEGVSRENTHETSAGVVCANG